MFVHEYFELVSCLSLESDRFHLWDSSVRIPDESTAATNLRKTASELAEGVGFEPTVPLQVRRFSRPVP
jgi:hypothetical protein